MSDIALVAIIGVAVAVASVLVKVVGFPDQFASNYKRKSVQGLSFWFVILTFVTYALWTLYGWLKGDWVVFLAQGALGTLTSGAILYQFLLYRHRDDDV